MSELVNLEGRDSELVNPQGRDSEVVNPQGRDSDYKKYKRNGLIIQIIQWFSQHTNNNNNEMAAGLKVLFSPSISNLNQMK